MMDADDGCSLDRCFEKIPAGIDSLTLFNDVRHLEPSTTQCVKHVHEDTADRCLVAKSQVKGYFNREMMNNFLHDNVSMQLNIANSSCQS